MKNIYQKNLEVLKRNYPSLAEKVESVDIDSIERCIVLQKTVSGHMVVGVSENGREWLLNSRLDPKRAAEIFAQGHPVKMFGIYFLFGLSDGRHIRHILSECDDTNRIMICEPDFDLFCSVCHFFDLSDVLEDKRTLLYLPETGENIEEILQKLIDYTNSRLLDFWILPGYDVLYQSACNDYMEHVVERMQNEIVQKSTRLAYERKSPRYTLFHMKNLIFHKCLTQLKQELQKHDLSNVPAIIVAAGPSLDKNVHLLKNVKGKAFIMVVDAALRAVIKAGVQPDIVCTIDSNSPDRFFDQMDLKDIVWCCNRGTKISLLQRDKDIFYYGFYTREWNEKLKQVAGFEYPEIKSGGSVATEAFMLAQYLGFKKLVFIGQDLAFTNGQSHTKGIEDALGDNDEYIKNRYLVQVEGINGKMLDTDFQMWYYKQWIEKAIKHYENELTVIDATEGGAKIEGAINCTLEEVVQTDCKKELDIYQMEKKLPPVFNEKQREELLSYLRDIKERAKQFSKRIEKMILQQKNILRRIKRGNFDKNQLLFELNVIMKQSEELKRAPEMDLIVFYAQQEEYEFGDQIYAEENLSVEELIQKSIDLYKGYYKGCRMMLEDMDEVIRKD